MGCQTVIMILNDGMHIVKEHPKELMEEIQINSVGSRKANTQISNWIEVMPSHHNSDHRLYLSGDNMIEDVTYSTIDRYIQSGHPEFVEQMLKETDAILKRFKKYAKDRLQSK